MLETAPVWARVPIDHCTVLDWTVLDWTVLDWTVLDATPRDARVAPAERDR